ncbi:MAG: alpha/beta fold hydrolase [Flavobacteriales bacterium]
MFKKILLGIAVLLVLVIGGFYIYAQTVIIEFTEEQEDQINLAIERPVTSCVGEVGYAQNGNTRIWYDVQNPADSALGSLVLIMGLSADALAWPSYFMDGFLDAGYQVIRLDNRGVGMTDWDDFDPENPYSLSDMSDDVLAVLDTLGIEKAHIAGVSMGGMISQTLCIEHPERALSLTSIMSTPDVNDKELPALNYACFVDIGVNTFEYGLSESETDAVKMSLAVRTLLMGSEKYELDIDRITNVTLYNFRERNGANRESGQQQITAIEKSGSRNEALQSLTVPTLVIHGKTDPLIPFEHGVKTAELIPNSKTLWIDGLGHIISEKDSEEIVATMVDFMNTSNVN